MFSSIKDGKISKLPPSEIIRNTIAKMPVSFNKQLSSLPKYELEWKENFCFVQGADSQFGMFSSFRDKRSIAELEWEREKELARICVNKINNMKPKPKFFVICGDLTDAMPDDATLIDYKKRQESDFIEIFSHLEGVPLVCVCGNHDIGNQPTMETVKRYRGVFGEDYFSFWVGGVMFLVLNSQYYFDGSLIPDLVKEQDSWLDQRLEESKVSTFDCGPVIFMHIPPFLFKPEETDAGYFALPLDVRNPLLEKLYNAGVRYVFCGHYHRNAGGFYKQLEVIVTSALGCGLGEDKSGMRLVQVTKNKITHQYYAFEDFPSTN